VKERGAPEAFHWQYKATMLRVDPGKVVRGNFYLPHTWHITQQTEANSKACQEEFFDEITSSA
jgi:hypothetical protein